MTRYRAIADEVAAEAARCGTADVRLIAVSKTVDADAVADAAAQGARDFGENRIEGLAEKATAFPELTWHFIGHIQSRKIPQIVEYADLIHSLVHHHHAEAINRAAKAHGKVQSVLIEVNVSGEASKDGVAPEEALELVQFVSGLSAVSVRGLMTMAPRDDAAGARAAFERLSALRAEIASALDPTAAQAFRELSMGMSDDWKCAIECGATMVRIGRAIFSDDYREERS